MIKTNHHPVFRSLLIFAVCLALQVAILTEAVPLAAAEPLAPTPAVSGWSAEFGPTGLEEASRVTTFVEFNGDMVIGGRFHRYYGMTENWGVSRWNGTNWEPLGGMLKEAHCLAVHGGRLLAGGWYGTPDEKWKEGLAVLDNGQWRVFPGGLRGEVRVLAEYNGDLVAGGRFVIEAEEPILHIARWDGKCWSPLGEGVDLGGRTRVEALEVHDGELIVGGVFGLAGGIETNNIARWDGRNWHSFDAGADDAVNVLLSHGGDLFAAGRFTRISGIEAARVAAWDGSAWRPLGSGIGGGPAAETAVNDLAIWRDRLVAGGFFTVAGDVQAGSIASWDGRCWSAMPTGFSDPSRHSRDSWRTKVFALAVADGRLAAAGELAGGEGFLLNHFGLWDGDRWDPLITGEGVEYYCRIKEFGGKLFLNTSGAAGAGNARGLVFWEDGRWNPFTSTAGDAIVSEQKMDLIVEHRGRLAAMIKQETPREEGARAHRRWVLAEWDGGWRPVSDPILFDAAGVDRLLSVGDEIVVAGKFEFPAGEEGTLVSWDGEEWRLLDPSDDAHRYEEIAVVGDRLYASRTIFAEGEPARYILREWNRGSWRRIKSGEHCRISTMAEIEGKLTVAFRLLDEKCTEPGMIQQWDGSRWRPLPGMFSARHAGDGAIESLAEYRGCLVAAGNFSGVDDIVCKGVAFLHEGVWRPLAGGVDGEVSGLVPMESSLWASGRLITADGNPSRQVARWDGPLPVGTSLEELPRYEPEPKPSVLRGDGWHSHTMDMTEPPPPFANGDFGLWHDGMPESWVWLPGLGGCDNSPAGCEALRPLPEGGLGFRVCTRENRHVKLAQRFSISGDLSYRIRADYGVFGEPDGSAPEALMGLSVYDREDSGYEYGALQSISVPLGGDDLNTAEIIIRTDPRTDVGILKFHVASESVELRLREVTIDTVRLTGDDMARMVIAELRRNFVPQSDRTVDWDAVERKFMGPEVDRETNTNHWALDLLASLSEPRVTLARSEADGTLISTLANEAPVPPADLLTRERRGRIATRLRDWPQPRGGGWTRDGIAYVELDSPHEMEWMLVELAMAQGVLIDLRASRSIDRPRLQEVSRLAGHFAREVQVAGYCRAGTALSAPERPLMVEPADGVRLRMPVVCLIGQGCKGGAADFALMMKSLPNVTMVGRSTRGGAGVISDYYLPTGRRVSFPSRSLWTPDGELVNDDHGVQPDVYVESDAAAESEGRDPVFEAGLRVLREKIASAAGRR